MSTNNENRVVAIALDGVEPTLIRQWLDEGELPVMKSIEDNGAWFDLEGVRDFFSGSVWPSFITGALASDHGFYGFAQLKPGTAELELAHGSTLKIPPFYAQLKDANKRVAVVDVAKAEPAKGVNGVQIVAWGSHSPAHKPASIPPDLIDEMTQRYGNHPGSIIDEDSAPNARYYRRLIKALDIGCERRTEICKDLMRREDWDLFIAMYSEAHSAGHKLWHLIDPKHPDYDPNAPKDLIDGMLHVHKTLDSEMGKLRDAAPDTNFLVFSMHGMGLDYNEGPTILLPEFMRRFSDIDPNEEAEKPPLKVRVYEGLRNMAPEWMRNVIKHRMTIAARARMRLLKFIDAHDAPLWHKMRAFSLPSDEGGFIRINLKGREPNGLVDPKDYDAICDELIERLMELKDPNLNCKAVNRVFRVREDHHGKYTDVLPDLVVEWREEPLMSLWSPVYGDIGTATIHRTGSHRPRGFLLAQGPKITPGFSAKGKSMDVPATILKLLGEPKQEQTVGKPLQPAA